MPPRLPYRAASHGRIPRPISGRGYRAPCLICQLSHLSTRRVSLSRKRLPALAAPSVRQQSTQPAVNDVIAYPPTLNPAGELKSALYDLQREARSYTNLSRLQLALRGLEQGPGQETIRVGVLWLAGPEQTSSHVRELVRLLVADPLKEEEEWERELLAEQHGGRPVLLRIGGDSQTGKSHTGTVRITSNPLMQELSVFSPTLKNHKLEILVLDSTGLPLSTEQDGLTDTILVPTVEIPVSRSGRYTPVTTPVHKAIVVGDGFAGAASLFKLGSQVDPELITSAVNFPAQFSNFPDTLPFQLIDVTLAKEALNSFRKSVDNAMLYEHNWFKSNVPKIVDWLKAGTADTPDGKAMKPSVHSLISALLTESNNRIQAEESRQLSATLTSTISAPALESLRSDLRKWAERAHTELRDQLDIAFAGRRWRKLGWWKLFWRVDDVSMIATDILNQRFLPEAEKEIIYVAGKIAQAGVLPEVSPVPLGANWAYKPIAPSPPSDNGLGSAPPPPRLPELLDAQTDDTWLHGPPLKPQPWPLHIPTTRAYLALDTLPALQALAQKLVLQTLSTAGFSSALAALVYVSTLSTSIYEAGAVAALGIIWSLRRLQTKWEAARAFWEGEVHEDGRLAVRAVESAVARVLAAATRRGRSVTDDGTSGGEDEIQRARRAVERAEEALERVVVGTDRAGK